MSQYGTQYAQYQASFGPSKTALGNETARTPLKTGQQNSGNAIAVMSLLFVPWVFFSLIFGLSCFSVRHLHQELVYVCWVLGAMFVLWVFYKAFRAWGNEKGSQSRKVGCWRWWSAVAVLSLLGLTLGFVMGDMNYYYNLGPYYDVQNLQQYRDVDPSTMNGNMLMDAGQILFKEGSYVDLRKTMGFKNLDWYCVAPITSGQPQQTSFDFWAVGLNCCSGLSTDFRCGEFNNNDARSALRLMRDDQRPYYRLAVQQAEAAFKITATHPMFFYWLQDPTVEMNAYHDDGFKMYLVGVFTWLACSIFITIGALALKFTGR